MTTTAHPTQATLHHRIDDLLAKHLEQLAAPSPLHDALQHSLLAPGKRLRPLLVYTTGLSLGGDLSQLDSAAVAIECVHTYSLIHDDLPAMDDADLRRGLPSCHAAFDEATAILAGDALLTWAFEWLASDRRLPAATRCAMVTCLAQAAGPAGMVAGQCMDLTGSADHMAALQTMHRLKTGELIAVCLRMACLATHTPWDQRWDTLGHAIGLAYQLQDDLLDAHGCPTVLGKPAGQDARHDKTTAAQHAPTWLHDAAHTIHDHLTLLALHHTPLADLLDTIRKRKK